MVAGVLSVLLPSAVLTQSAFEVASVKRNTTGNTGWSITYTADSLHATNATLAALIQSAYGIILEDRLVGGPSWVRTWRFDVNAKAAEAQPREKLRLLAQRLLEDRFGVVLKKEQRGQEVYALRLARDDGRTGPNLRRAAGDCIENLSARTMPKSSTGAAPTTSGWCATLESLATLLTKILRVAVVDQTRLPGRWDFVLAFSALTADASPAANPGPLDVARDKPLDLARDKPLDVARDKQTTLPTVFVAVQEQLGLKLERNARGSIEYTVIAAAHAPADN